MITKHVAMRSLSKSDFAGLANYVTGVQNKNHRLGQVQITNCDAVSGRRVSRPVAKPSHKPS